MTFTLHVDGERWRAHAGALRDAVRRSISGGTHQHADGDLVPVAKGNGYGLGNVRLAARRRALGLTRLAVGTVFEVAEVGAAYDGDMLVLTPFEPARQRRRRRLARGRAAAPYADRVVRTVSSPRRRGTPLAAGPGPVRVVLEALTSMGRFGLTADELAALLADAVERRRAGRRAGPPRGPRAAPAARAAARRPPRRPGSRWHDARSRPAPPAGATRRVVEALAWGLGWLRAAADLTDRVAADGAAEAPSRGSRRRRAVGEPPRRRRARVAARGAARHRAVRPHRHAALARRPRRARARGTVLAVHGVARGQASGYRQRRAGRAGAVVVVGGGTSHGVALEAPSPVVVAPARGGRRHRCPRRRRPRALAVPRRRRAALVRRAAAHAGVAGPRPAGHALPAVGEEVDVDVRLTTAPRPRHRPRLTSLREPTRPDRRSRHRSGRPGPVWNSVPIWRYGQAMSADLEPARVSQTKTIHEYLAENPNVDVSETHAALLGDPHRAAGPRAERCSRWSSSRRPRASTTGRPRTALGGVDATCTGDRRPSTSPTRGSATARPRSWT